MKTKILIWLMVAILLISPVFAVVNDAHIYWSIDQTARSGTTFIDLAKNHNATQSGGTIVRGIINDSYNLGNSGATNNGATFTSHNFYGAGINNAFALSFWLNTTAHRGTYYVIFSNLTNFATNYIYILTTGTFGLVGGGVTCSIAASAIPINKKLEYYVITRDVNNMTRIYRNGTMMKSQDCKARMQLSTIGKYDTTYSYNGIIDEVGIYFHNLTQADVTTLYNNHLGYNPMGGSSTPTNTNVSFKLKANNTNPKQIISIFNATFYVKGELSKFGSSTSNSVIINLNKTKRYNITLRSNDFVTGYITNRNVSSNMTFNMTPYVYVNGPADNASYIADPTLNFTPRANLDWCGAYSTNSATAHSELNNLINATIYYPTLSTSILTQGYNTWYIRCNLTNGIMVNSSTRYLWLDTGKPSVATGFINNKWYYQDSTTNITAKFNFTDALLLFKYNISIDGIPLAGHTFTTNAKREYNLSKDPSTLTKGRHNITARYADGHTANEIGEYQIEDGLFNDVLTFIDESKKVTINPEGFDIKDEFTTTKMQDRYTFTYRPTQIKNEYSFYVITDDEQSIVENQETEYKKWIIAGEKWIDFNLPKDKGTIVTIEPLSDHKSLVTISNLNFPLLQEYASIGELNVVTTTYNFSVFNITTTYQASTIEEQSSTASLILWHNSTTPPTSNITFKFNHTIQNFTATNTTSKKTFNSTIISPRVYGNLSVPVPLWWNLSVGGYNYYFNYNMTVFPLRLSDCRLNASWPVILTFHSVKEESNQTEYVPNMDLNVDMDLQLTPTSHINNVFFEFHGGNNYSVCIQPNVTTLTADAIIEYQATGYTHRKYYLVDFPLASALNNVYLYHLNTSKASDIIMSVYDKNTGEPIPNVYIKILRYYPNLNEYKTVEIEKTDENGQTLSKMVLADVFYKFMLEYNGLVVLDSSVQKMLTTTKIFYLTLGSDMLESFRKIDSISTSVTCTNTTKTCRFTWSDSTNLVKTANLRVFRINGFGKTMIYQGNGSGPAGTLTYVITENTNNSMYEAMGYIHTNTTNSGYTFGPATMSFIKQMKDLFKKTGLFPLLLLLISMMCALLDIGAIGVIAGSMIVLLLGIITGILPLTITMWISLLVMAGVLISRIRI